MFWLLTAKVVTREVSPKLKYFYGQYYRQFVKDVVNTYPAKNINATITTLANICTFVQVANFNIAEFEIFPYSIKFYLS